MNVPTWNYATVHVHGRAKVIEDRKEIIAFLTRMVNRYEPGSEQAFRVAKLPEEFLDKFLPQIVVFRLVPSQVLASFKLSQNRNETDLRNIILALETRGTDMDRDVARLMTMHAKPENRAK